MKLGDGTIGNSFGLGDEVIEIPNKFICEDSLIKDVFGESISLSMIEGNSKIAILCPKNIDTLKH
jgi:hypothetical protein